MSDWLDDGLSGCEFNYKRLGERSKKIAKTVATGCGHSIPHVCQEWEMTESVYRFLSNDRIDVSKIPAGYFGKAQERINACHGQILMLHDTTELSYKREAPHAIDHTRKLPTSERVKAASGAQLTACGILMHASFASTLEGLPLTLGSIRL